jgi:hypothetical protein
MRRMMPSTSTGAPERLMAEGPPADAVAGVCAPARGAAEAVRRAAARTEKITLFIGFLKFLTTEKEFRRGFYGKIQKTPAEQIIQMPERRRVLPPREFKVQSSKSKVGGKAFVLDFEL